MKILILRWCLDVIKYWYSRLDLNINNCFSHFWTKKLPEIGRAIGQSLGEFKKSTRELTADTFDEVKEKQDDKKL